VSVPSGLAMWGWFAPRKTMAYGNTLTRPTWFVWAAEPRLTVGEPGEAKVERKHERLERERQTTVKYGA